MNFWSSSVKSKSPAQNESFYFDQETPRGHLIAMLDIAPHDYANLDATLERKLETIVESFDSVPTFSADLFLGFLAKEINNFLYQLEKQSVGPQLNCSGAICLVSGNRLAYVLCGDTQLNLLQGGRALSLSGDESNVLESEAEDSEGEWKEVTSGQQTEMRLDELGVRYWDAPLTGRVQAFTLDDEDVVIFNTDGEQPFSQPEVSLVIQDIGSSDPREIGEALAASSDDFGAVLVISGPYDQYADPLLADSVGAVDSFEEGRSDFAESGQRADGVSDLIERTLEGQLEQRISPQIEELKDGLRSKANSIDILELNEILKNLSAAVAGKADTAAVLELQRDVLKLGLGSNGHLVKGTDDARRQSGLAGDVVPFSASQPDDSYLREPAGSGVGPAMAQATRQSSLSLRTALLVLAVAVAGAFIGAWLQSRVLKKNPEVWAVKTSGNQIWINRMDQGGKGDVTLNVATPVRSRGEQTFSSFADVKQYIDTITISPSPADPPIQVGQGSQDYENKQAETVAIAKPEASSKRSSQPEKITTKKPSELTASLSKKPEIRSPKKVAVPSASSPASAMSLQRDRRVASTTPVTVGSGDTLIKLAHRYKTTPDQLKKLNPQINEQGVIRPSQKILVPATGSPKDAKSKRTMLVKQSN